MQTKKPSQDNTTKQLRNSIAFDQLCIELQYAFVAPSDELINLNYLNLKNNSSSNSTSTCIGYHVPSLIFEQSSLLLRPSTYKEIVEERAALKICGLPICSNKLKSVPNRNKTYYRLNLKKKEIFEEKDSFFCGTKCCKKSMEFEVNLEDVAIQFKSHSLDAIKQALQLIFSWYKGKIKINTNLDIDTTSNDKPRNPEINEINQRVKDLKIIEKNVEFNLHQINDPNLSNKQIHKKWKRPIGHNQKEINKINKNNKIKQNKNENKNDDDNDINMTEMDKLFRIQQEEKQKLKSKNIKNESKDRNMMMDESMNGRKIKINSEMDKEKLLKIENERIRIEKEEKHRILYDSMSDNAQLMGYYISWCTDATTWFIMNDKMGYLNWKKKEVIDQILKQRQESLIGNVIKYIMGLLNKFTVNPILTSTVCNEIHSLIETFHINTAIPTFTAKTWCFVGFVFLKLISHRIGDLKKEMFQKQDKVKNVLKTIGFGEEYVATFEQIVVLE